LADVLEEDDLEVKAPDSPDIIALSLVITSYSK
jgi:hypothetical protein